MTRRCECPQGCDYKIDDYGDDEFVCGACLDNCEGAAEFEEEMRANA